MMPPNKPPSKRAAARQGNQNDQDKPPVTLLAAMTGKASAERIDALAARSVPGIQRAVKWGMAYYGVEGGWCFSTGAFVGHAKLMFIRGTGLKPEPPVTLIGMGKSTRGVEIVAVDALDELQMAAWMQQAATMPFAGGKKR
jgi:hypothetical protein